MQWIASLDWTRREARQTLSRSKAVSGRNLKKLSDYILEAETIFTCFRHEAFTTLSATQGVVGGSLL
jgi:hypothetical protein